MARYNEVLKFTAHKNHENWDGDIPKQKTKPNYGNGSIVLHSDLPAGEYSVSVWQYADSMNLGVNLSSVDRSEDEQAPAAAAPLPQARRSLSDA